MSNPLFLIACYEIIKGKPGNMTPGAYSKQLTLPLPLSPRRNRGKIAGGLGGGGDGISKEWFYKIADELKKGKYQFNPSPPPLRGGGGFRIQEIPKSNGKVRRLGINGPRQKIVQKALELIIRSI